ncbi:DUF4153 domain-containing protein [Oceanobacillus sp. FSL H7-0719]|uniref:DUF4153 domain-containing protein n=1 Tax=Oceanobacillus sp. FSL H7-0719 TaxID=2954507 RepID=UPI0032462056
MSIGTKQRDWIFLLACLGLGVLAERSFFNGRIGISYIIFIAAFYAVLFLRFRFSFEHRRIGLLLMTGIWILAGGYLFFDSTVFSVLNVLVIPAVVFFQIVLITSPGKLNWSKLSFVKLVTAKLLDALSYLVHYLSIISRKLLRRKKREGSNVLRQMFFGAVIALPLLFIIIRLLMSADDMFHDLMLKLFFLRFEFSVIDIGVRTGIILVATLFFFCIFQVLGRRTKRELEIKEVSGRKAMPGVMAATILTSLNTVYLLFIAVQFSYFFNGGLQEGFTYADYARKGFFELLVVTMINWTILIGFLKRVKPESKGLKVFVKSLYSALIIESGILLLSAYQRLSLYEEMYGYTIDRLLAHSFMLFLIVIFAYTFIRVWLENLSLLHFYLISGFLFYTILNVINLEEIIVENNLGRYEETGKIDIYYLEYLGAEGMKGLVSLYEQDPDYPELKQLLYEKKSILHDSDIESWQGFNFPRKEAKEMLEELEL